MDPIKEIVQTEREIRRLRRLADQMESELDNFCRMALQPGQTKSVGGKNYVWKKGKSGKARWHRSDRTPPGRHKIAQSKPTGPGGQGKQYFPQYRGGDGNQPIYGHKDKVVQEVDPGEKITSSTDTWSDAYRRTEKSAALLRVKDRPDIQSMLADVDGDGIDEGARVGIPGKAVQPPPPIKRVKGLTGKQQVAEAEFITAYETNRQEMVDLATARFVDQGQKKGAGGPIFETDDVKNLAPAHWAAGANRADNNVALHQVANAICKKSFKDYIATLPKGSNILVTCGGCGAGKGFVLKNNPIAKPLMGKAQAVWDSAGDQNATENPWIQEEAEKHGHNVTYMYVHNDPLESWAGQFGVVQRSLNPEDGRMVTARVFADSYALGAKNHAAFVEKNKGNPNAKFLFFRNGKNPEMIAGIPPEAEHDADQLYEYALGVIDQRHDLPPYIRSAATFKFGG